MDKSDIVIKQEVAMHKLKSDYIYNVCARFTRVTPLREKVYLFCDRVQAVGIPLSLSERSCIPPVPPLAELG